MGFVKIIALDLGKFKTVCCVMDVASRAHAFETIETSPANVHDLLVRHVTADAPADTKSGHSYRYGTGACAARHAVTGVGGDPDWGTLPTSHVQPQPRRGGSTDGSFGQPI